jgi:transposase
VCSPNRPGIRSQPGNQPSARSAAGVFPSPGKGFRLRAPQGGIDPADRISDSHALRRIGAARLEKWLRDRHAYNAGDIADRAIAAANSQRTVVIGQDVAATVVARLARNVLDLNDELADVDAVIEAKFQQHRLAPIITSMPGFGSLLGAELLAATNGDLTSFTSADRLAGIAGLAPVPRDSGRITGNLKRPRRYDRRLLRVFYLAANNSIKTSPESRNYHDRKRSQGKRHSQAVLCLARRRLNVLWAMQRDNLSYQPGMPRAA